MGRSGRTHQFQPLTCQGDRAGENKVKLSQRLVKSLTGSSSCCLFFMQNRSNLEPPVTPCLPRDKAVWGAVEHLLLWLWVHPTPRWLESPTWK